MGVLGERWEGGGSKEGGGGGGGGGGKREGGRRREGGRGTRDEGRRRREEGGGRREEGGGRREEKQLLYVVCFACSSKLFRVDGHVLSTWRMCSLVDGLTPPNRFYWPTTSILYNFHQIPLFQASDSSAPTSSPL